MKFSELIKQPEGRRLEFKEILPASSNLAKSIVAFANDAGGEMVGTRLGLSWHQVEELLDYCIENRSIIDIMSMMEWKDRTKFRKKFISPLIEEGVLMMTKPEYPTSPNQRYYLTEKGILFLQKIREKITK